MPKHEPYKYLEHTADVEFVAFGKDAQECFTNALLATFNTISYTKKIESSKEKKITFIVNDKAKSLGDLLWYALQDAVSIADSKSLFAYKVLHMKIIENKGTYKINAKIAAKAREEKASKLDVKGVSRYNLKVKNTREGTEATVVLDV